MHEGTWAGHNAIKVTVPAKWERRLNMYKEGPYGYKVSIIPQSKKHLPATAPRQKKQIVKTVRGIIQHPDLSFETNNKEENNEKLLLALNARQNGIITAHQVGQDGNMVMVVI